MTHALRPLGDFLRASRGRVRPEDVGLPPGGERRVKGLRREEVASLAGVSVDYYVRLEQGRERHPSTQVVNALARLFRLDRDERIHLARLADLMPDVDIGPPAHEAAPELVTLLAAWDDTPAILFNEAYDPLAQNGLGRALFSVFQNENLALSVFLDPAGREFYLDWATVACDMARALRRSAVRWPRSPRLSVVLSTLLQNSADFRCLWRDTRVSGMRRTTKDLQHPSVGALHLTVQTFESRAAPGHELMVYHAQPGSVSDERLRILGTVAASRAA